MSDTIIETPLAHILRASVAETQQRRLADQEEEIKTLRRLVEHWMRRAMKSENALEHVRQTIERAV